MFVIVIIVVDLSCVIITTASSLQVQHLLFAFSLLFLCPSLLSLLYIISYIIMILLSSFSS